MKKTIWGIKWVNKEGLFYHKVMFESYAEALLAVEEGKELTTDTEFLIDHFIFVPKKCPHCNHFELMTILDNEPRAPVHYQCPECDSTFEYVK